MAETVTVAEIERQRLVMRAREQLYEIDQLFTDAAAWNDSSRARLEEGADPIDADPDGTMARLRTGLRAFVARESAREAERMK